jgi:hypothetical protein
MRGAESFIIINLVSQGAEEQLFYMVAQIIGLIITGFGLFFAWNWLFLTRYKRRSIGGKIIYSLVMVLWILFTAAISFFAYFKSPAFVLPIVVVIILGLIKSRKYKELGI